MFLLLQKSKQAKTRADFKRKKARSKNEIVVFELSMPGLQLDAATTDSHLIQAWKFRAAHRVGPESCSLNQIRSVTSAIKAGKFRAT